MNMQYFLWDNVRILWQGETFQEWIPFFAGESIVVGFSWWSGAQTPLLDKSFGSDVEQSVGHEIKFQHSLSGYTNKLIAVPDSFLRLDKDGFVTVMLDAQVFGSGIVPLLTLLIAENLSVKLSMIRIRCVPEPCSDNLHGAGRYSTDHSFHHSQKGSNSQKEAQREEALTTVTLTRFVGVLSVLRMILIQIAAKRWNVPESSCRICAGKVIHTYSKRWLYFGELLTASAIKRTNIIESASILSF